MNSGAHMDFRITFGYGNDQHFDGILSFSEDDRRRLDKYHENVMRLNRCRMLSENLITQSASYDVFNGVVSHPPEIPEVDLIHFMTFLRPFMYKRDYPNFKCVLRTVMQPLAHLPFFVDYETELRDMFELKLADKHLELAREHIGRDRQFHSGEIADLGGGIGWLHAMHFGYVESANSKFVKSWLYGHLFHQEEERIDAWDEISTLHSTAEIHTALRAHLLYIYNAIGALNNIIVRFIYCMDHQNELGVA